MQILFYILALDKHLTERISLYDKRTNVYFIRDAPPDAPGMPLFTLQQLYTAPIFLACVGIFGRVLKFFAMTTTDSETQQIFSGKRICLFRNLL